MSLLIPYLVVVSIFTKSLETIFKVGEVGLDIYSYTLIPLLFCVFIFDDRCRFKYSFFIVLIAFITLQVIIKITFDLEMVPFIKQIIPVVIFFYVSYQVCSKFDVKILFGIYYKISIFIAILGLLQFFFERLGVSIFVQYPGRLNSIMPEASHFATVIIPAVIYSWLYDKSLLRKTLLIGSLLLTMSSAGYLVFAISLMLHYRRYFIKTFISSVFISLALIILYLYIEAFKYRIDDIISFSSNLDLYMINATTYSFVSNFQVAIYSLFDTFLLGSGLGGHSEYYVRYFLATDSNMFNYRLFGLNMPSGHSLFIRGLSELGLIFIVVFSRFIFIILRTMPRIDDYELYVIYVSCLSILVFRLFKFGGYFDYGLPFFLSILFVLNGIYSKSRINKRDNF